MKILKVNDSNYEAAYNVLVQLRKNLSLLDFKRMIQENVYDFYVYENGNEIIGVCGCRIMETITRGIHCHIHDLVIDENNRKKGLGKRLILEMKEFALRNKCKWIFLDGIDSALGFYHNIGFEKHGATLLKIKIIE